MSVINRLAHRVMQPWSKDIKAGFRANVVFVALVFILAVLILFLVQRG